ncbi:MAG: hypothetical protein Q8S20_15565, partial [Sulfuritalea sp.]|nr:hypothetical protein [Sulfuritalea sp.]
WLTGYPGQLRTCMGGPACILWENALPGTRNLPIEETLNDAASLLSGTGWASDLEHEARKLALTKGIRNIAVLDHWTNYRERFVRGGELVLPDELWVADTDAEAEARRCFPALPVRRLPNLYLERLAREVAAYHPTPARRDPQNILYVLEPVRQDWGRSGEPGEFQALAFFLESLPSLGIDEHVKIRLRPHPSDPPGKYDDWPLRYPTLDLSINASGALAEQIAWADWIVGCETFALVIALQAGRIAVSVLPPWAPHCRLPQQDLLHLRDLLARPA